MIRQRYYNPGQLTDAELKAGFVVRQYEFKELVKIIRQEPASGPLQHILVIGPRGMGKTSLGLRALVEVRETPELSAIWQPVPFFEESYGVSDLAALWLTALRHLSDATKEPEWAKRADALLAREKDADRLAAAAYAALADYRQQSGKRPILFIENLDDLFNQFLNKRDLAGLRSLLQERNDLLLLGTANSVFEAIASHGEPFYEFFRRVKLRGLEREETMSFLEQLAQRPELASLQEVLTNDPGRVAAVRSLTGGNPRLIALAAKMMSESPVGTAREDLERLIDDQTPYFKARIETLPAQARVVFHTLAAGWEPMLASEVAAKARLSSSHASAQLKHLTERGYTEAVEGPTKRNRRYQILERFYNVYYLLRFTRDQKSRLEKTIDFISAIFGSSALSQMATATIERMIAEPGASGEDLDTLRILVERIEKEYNQKDSSEFWRRFVGMCRSNNFPNIDIMTHGIDVISEDEETLRNAIHAIDKYLSVNKSDSQTWILLSYFLIKSKDPHGAHRALICSNDTGSEVDYIWQAVGDSFMEADNKNNALRAFQNAVIINPQNQLSWKMISKIIDNTGHHHNSVIAAKNSANINPFNINSIGVPISSIRSRNTSDSLTTEIISKNITAVDPQSFVGLQSTGAHLACRGEYEHAYQCFLRSSYISIDRDYYIMALASATAAALLSRDKDKIIFCLTEITSSFERKKGGDLTEGATTTLAEAAMFICAKGYGAEIIEILGTGLLATAFEPLLYAIKLEIGEEISPLPVEMQEAVKEARYQIASLRQREADGRQS